MKLKAYVQLARPAQWLKNLMLYFPPFLGGELFTSGRAALGILPLCAFCLVSSATYIVNDIVDADRDHHHPRKASRPIPSGDVSVSAAKALSVVLAIGGFSLAYQSSTRIALLLATYVLVTLSYSFYLKNYPLVDIFCIASGFVIRLFSGGVAFGIEISSWLFLSVFLLALFLSTGKRVHERVLLGETAEGHRRSLSGYPPGFLDGVMYLCGGAVLVTYSMYSVSRSFLVFTVPLCAFGLLRFIMLVRTGQVGDPTDSLLRDFQLFVVSVVWVAMVAFAIYGR